MARSFRIALALVPVALLAATAAAQAAHPPKKDSPAPAASRTCDTTFAGSRIRLPQGKCGATGYQWRSIPGGALSANGAQPGRVISEYPRN